MTLARALTQTTQSGVERTNYGATVPPHLSYYGAWKFSRFLFLHIDFSSHLIKKTLKLKWHGNELSSVIFKQYFWSGKLVPRGQDKMDSN